MACFGYQISIIILVCRWLGTLKKVIGTIYLVLLYRLNHQLLLVSCQVTCWNMSKKCHFLRFLWVSTTVRTSSECYVCVSPCKSLKWSFQKRAKGGPQQSEPASTLLCLAHHNRDDLQQQSLALWMVIKIWAAKKKPMLLSSSTDSWKWPCLWTTISLSKSETRIQSSKEMDKSPTFTSFLKPLSDE